MLVIPGGGYVWESFDNEGTRQAAWLNARGITAFILVYRLPAEGWARHADVPLQDAQRAMRLIRAARKLATALGPAGDGTDIAELAAWTVVGNILLNLDETITKE